MGGQRTNGGRTTGRHIASAVDSLAEAKKASRLGYRQQFIREVIRQMVPVNTIMPVTDRCVSIGN